MVRHLRFALMSCRFLKILSDLYTQQIQAKNPFWGDRNYIRGNTLHGELSTLKCSLRNIPKEIVKWVKLHNVPKVNASLSISFTKRGARLLLRAGPWVLCIRRRHPDFPHKGLHSAASGHIIHIESFKGIDENLLPGDFNSVSPPPPLPSAPGRSPSWDRKWARGPNGGQYWALYLIWVKRPLFWPIPASEQNKCLQIKCNREDPSVSYFHR